MGTAMTPSNEELDRRVAELQGFKQEGPYLWRDKHGIPVVDGLPYEPTTNNDQAMELQIKYKVDVLWQKDNEWNKPHKCAAVTREQADIQGLVGYADNPREAIVRAVIAHLESER